MKRDIKFLEIHMKFLGIHFFQWNFFVKSMRDYDVCDACIVAHVVSLRIDCFSSAKFFHEIFPLLKNTEEELSIIDAPQHVDEEFQLGRLYFKLPFGQKIHKRALSKFVIKLKYQQKD